jgi:hypothetical protein
MVVEQAPNPICILMQNEPFSTRWMGIPEQLAQSVDRHDFGQMAVEISEYLHIDRGRIDLLAINEQQQPRLAPKRTRAASKPDAGPFPSPDFPFYG